MRSSARTGPTPSRSSPTRSRSRARRVGRTSSSSATTSSTRSTSTTTGTHGPTSPTSSRSAARCRTRIRSSTTQARSVHWTTPTGTGVSSTTSRKLSGRGGPFGRNLGSHLASPPCNIGPRSTPNYAALAQAAVHTLPTGETVFADQRNDGFFVDLGAIFDLGDLRPFQHLHLIPSADAVSVDTLKTLNVHTIAIQIPIKNLTKDGSVPSSVNGSSSPKTWSASTYEALGSSATRQRHISQVAGHPRTSPTSLCLRRQPQASWTG